MCGIPKIEFGSWSTTNIVLVAVLTSSAFFVKYCSNEPFVVPPYGFRVMYTVPHWLPIEWIESEFLDFHIEKRVQRMWWPVQEIEMLAVVTIFEWYYWCALTWLMRIIEFPKCRYTLPMQPQSHKIAPNHLVMASIATIPTANKLERKMQPLRMDIHKMVL